MFNKNRMAMMNKRGGKRGPHGEAMERKPVGGPTPVRGGGGVPMQGPGGKPVRPDRPETKPNNPMLKRAGVGPLSMMNKRDMLSRAGLMKGGGLARKGVGAAYAKGGMVRGAGCATKGKKISSKMG